MTRESKYLEAAKRAFKVYLERDLDHFVCTSGAIDADTIDREAGVPMLFAAMDLYELTGSKDYLKALELAAYYLASWQWHYAPPMHPDSPLLNSNYDWFGGTGITVMASGGPGSTGVGCGRGRSRSGEPRAGLRIPSAKARAGSGGSVNRTLIWPTRFRGRIRPSQSPDRRHAAA
jgi:hypothetical protein